MQKLEFTKFMKKYMCPPKFTDEDFEYYYKKSKDKKGRLLWSQLKDGQHTYVSFNKGWVLYAVRGDNIVVSSFCIFPQSALSASRAWTIFRRFVKHNGFDKIIIFTQRKWQGWAKRWGFTLIEEAKSNDRWTEMEIAV